MTLVPLFTAFKGEHFADSASLARRLAPPYDVIGSSQRVALAALDQPTVVTRELAERIDAIIDDHFLTEAADQVGHVGGERPQLHRLFGQAFEHLVDGATHEHLVDSPGQPRAEPDLETLYKRVAAFFDKHLKQ